MLMLENFPGFVLPPSESGRGIPMSPLVQPGGWGVPRMTPNVQPAAIPLPPQPLSWREKLMRGLFPMQGMEDVMDPQALKGARVQGLMGIGQGLLEMSGPVVGGPAPSFGQALAHGLRRGQEAAGGGVQQGLMIDDRKRQMQSLQARQRVAQMFPLSPRDSREQTIGKLRGMMAALAQMGDLEGAGKLGEYLKSVDDAGASKNPQTPQEINLGDEIILREQGSGKIVDRYKRNPTPRTIEDVAQERRFRGTIENQIIGDFQTQTRGLQMAAQGYTSLNAAYKTPNLMQPIAMLYAFARVMDPESVVREGEIATLQKMGALDDQIRIAIEKARTGELPQDIRDYIKQQADANIREKYNMFKHYRGTAINRGEGVTDLKRLEKILVDPFRDLQLDGSAPRGGNRLLNK